MNKTFAIAMRMALYILPPSSLLAQLFFLGESRRGPEYSLMMSYLSPSS
jgi:hypothetical protein